MVIIHGLYQSRKLSRFIRYLSFPGNKALAQMGYGPIH